MNNRREKQEQDSASQKNQTPDSARITQEQRRSKENIYPEEQQPINPDSNEPSSEPSGFMKIIKKLGYSVWLIVMVIGAALAFIAALFLV